MSLRDLKHCAFSHFDQAACDPISLATAPVTVWIYLSHHNNNIQIQPNVEVLR